MSYYTKPELIEAAAEAGCRAVSCYQELNGNCLSKRATIGSYAASRQRAVANVGALIMARAVVGLDVDPWQLPECQKYVEEIRKCAHRVGALDADGYCDGLWTDALWHDAQAILNTNKGATFMKWALRIDEDVLCKAMMNTGYWTAENAEAFRKLA
jgi:hypothetical protein